MIPKKLNKKIKADFRDLRHREKPIIYGGAFWRK